ncbi:hypothetical protein J6590_059124 [Homalodisca vitripennis]|nr:hypothetical protein J6590_059124 [Homalodisca vitripennis]
MIDRREILDVFIAQSETQPRGDPLPPRLGAAVAAVCLVDFVVARKTSRRLREVALRDDSTGKGYAEVVKRYAAVALRDDSTGKEYVDVALRDDSTGKEHVDVALRDDSKGKGYADVALRDAPGALRNRQILLKIAQLLTGRF